ncbi:prepronociceptin-like [Thamnophis elegans]|uniref:prepronociceptin-like n=1 Tax=Thamnophis elegans TaxID=35005 RepID=UPI0013767D06|nr:prepronociceptin-like [Thamnophis elegans]XP_032071981.1 prepronociceptin-like [Thamnophis elegans]
MNSVNNFLMMVFEIVDGIKTTFNHLKYMSKLTINIWSQNGLVKLIFQRDIMRMLLWGILSFCLLVYAHNDCRKDCRNCHRHLYNHQDDISLLICVMECQGKLFPSATWGLCNKAISRKRSLSLDHSSLEEMKWPLEMWNGSLKGARNNLKHHSDLTRMLDLSDGEDKQVSKLSGLIHQPKAEDVTSDGSQTSLGDLQDQLKIPKRVGDFLRGPFNYGEMEEPKVRALQKRFGGFIGVRKYTRKWHNQKKTRSK